MGNETGSRKAEPFTLTGAWDTEASVRLSSTPFKGDPTNETREMRFQFPRFPTMARGYKALGMKPRPWCYRWFTVDVKLEKYRMAAPDEDGEVAVQATFMPQGEGKWT